MTFQELKPGYPLYFLSRNNVEIQTGTVTNVSNQHITTDPRKLSSQQLIMVVDATVTIGGQQRVIELPVTSTYTTSEDQSLLISPNKEDIMNGVRLIKSSSEEALKLIPQHKEYIKKCDALLKDFDPAYKQLEDNEERMNKFEHSLDELKSMMGSFQKTLETLMK